MIEIIQLLEFFQKYGMALSVLFTIFSVLAYYFGKLITSQSHLRETKHLIYAYGVFFLSIFVIPIILISFLLLNWFSKLLNRLLHISLHISSIWLYVCLFSLLLGYFYVWYRKERVKSNNKVLLWLPIFFIFNARLFLETIVQKSDIVLIFSYGLLLFWILGYGASKFGQVYFSITESLIQIIVRLDNGEKIEGILDKFDDDFISITSKEGKIYHIPISKVRLIERKN